MNRRSFIVKTSFLGSAITAAPSFITKPTFEEKSEKSEQSAAIEKVTRAMLSMQRASWEQGVALQAMLELGNEEMLYLMAKEAVLRQRDDGRLSVVYSDNGANDPAAAGEGVLHAYQMSGEKEFKVAADKMLEWLLVKAPRSKEGVIYHTMDSPQIWSDAFYMSPPFLAAAGKYTEALAQVDGLRKVLWNPEHQLFSHRWHDGEHKFLNKRFWGGGNGWAAASFSRIIRMMPENMRSEKEKIIEYHKQLLEGCLAQMREDGLFYDFINEPDTFVELNLTQMLAYSIFRGLKGGWLESSYQKPAEKMRKAAYAKIDAHGYVTGVCGAPAFQSSGRSTEGQAFFLLMESAYNDLNK
jgi:unsaturated rhamnogalacturonyl hydrolase